MQRSNSLLPVAFLCAIVMVASCGKSDTKPEVKASSNIPAQAKELAAKAPARPTSLKFQYGYDGQFGITGIADTVKAYDGGRLVAEAKALKIIEKDPGPDHVEVEETHYTGTGAEAYRGKIIIQFGFDGGKIIEEKPISGRRKFQVFRGWQVNR